MLDKYILSALMICIAIVISESFYIKYLLLKNNILENQILSLQNESVIQTKKFEEAAIKAKEAIVNSKINTNNIVLAEIPKKCEEAMAWGVKQAKQF